MATPKKHKQFVSIVGSFKWNGEINLGHVIAIITVIIASVALFYQRKELQTKVDDLQSVVDRLELERSERQLQGSQNEISRLNTFSSAVQLTSDQIEPLDESMDQEFIALLTEFDYLIGIVETNSHLTENKRQILNLLNQENAAKKEIYANAYIFIEKIIQFRTQFMPNRNEFLNDKEYTAAQKKYIDTLQKNTDFLLHRLDSIIKAPGQRLTETISKLGRLKN